MNYELAREVVGCLRVSDSPRMHGERLLTFDLREWRRTLRWLDEAGLTLLLWRRLEELGIASALGAELRAAFDRNFSDHRRRVAEMAREFEVINHTFEAAGVEYAALKGFALVPEYCPLASLRTTYDYDYLVHPVELERARQALEAAHYRARPVAVGEPLEYIHEARPTRSPLSRDDLYSAGFPRSIDLHWQIWNPDELTIDLDFQVDALARRRSRYLTPEQLGVEESQACSGLRFWTLCEEDELLFQLLHAFRHILQDWCRLASLLDVARFVQGRSSDTVFWEGFVERVRPCPRLREITGLVLSLSTQLFRTALPEVVAAKITTSMRNAVALWIDRYGLESALSNFSRNKFSLLLHREFLEDVSTWQSIERRRLFPLHRPNRAAVAATPTLLARVTVGLTQSAYVVRRLHHHVLGTAQYRLERLRWERLFKGSRVAAPPPPEQDATVTPPMK